MLSNYSIKKDKSKISQANIILGIILIVLIVVVLVISLLIRMNDEPMPLNGLGGKIDSIEVTKLGKTTTLVYQVDKWVVANYNNQIAKQDYVIDIFDTLDRLVVVDVVSDNPNKQSVYQVDESGIQVVMKLGEKVIQNFVVGKNGPSWPSSYLRWQGEDEVYLVREVLPQAFSWGEWRNMTIVQLTSDLIKGLKWDNGLEVIKESGNWQVISPKGSVVDEAKIKTILDSLSNLEAIDIAPIQAWDLNQQDADFILEILTNNEVSYRLAFWNHPNDDGDYNYYVVREGDDIVYILFKNVAENMEQKIEFLED